MSDRILKTKIQPPRPRPGSVERVRLLSRLDSALAHRLTLVSAPAGSGKTTLLADWIALRQREVAWISLDALDGDERRFLAYLIAAFRSLPELGMLGEAARSGLEEEPPLPAKAALGSLINDLAECEREIVLVLDDYHLIESIEVHRALDFFVAHAPENLRLVVLSRSDPPLPLGRLRLGGELAELRAEELRFRAEEAGSLVQGIAGLDLKPDWIDALARRTEGWAAGLQAAALSLRGRDDPEAFITGFAGSHRYVLDFLDEEVVSRQPESVRTFLLRCSILRRLSGPLCDALLEGEPGDGAAMLERCERENLFIRALDDEQQWFGIHRLFADLLLHRLRREQPDLLSRLHRRASDWHAAEGLTEEAVFHAIEAGDFEHTADLIEAASAELLEFRESRTLIGWLDALPEELVRRRPRLCIARAWALLHSASMQEAEAWVEIAEAALDSSKENVPDALRGELAALQARIASWKGDVAQTITFGQAALSLLPPGVALRAEVTLSMGIAHHLRGSVNEALAAFDTAARIGQRDEDRFMEQRARCMQAEALKMAGRLHDADRLAREAIALGSAPDRTEAPATGRAWVVLGNVRRAQNRLDEAMECAERAMALGERGGSRVIQVSARLLLAHVQEARHEIDAALATLDEVERLGGDYVRSGTEMFRIRIALSQGDPEPARRWARAYQATREVDSASSTLPNPFEREQRDMLLARLLRIDGRPREATEILEALRADIEDAGRWENRLYLDLESALAHHAAGDETSAMAAFERSLAIGETEGYVGAFLEEPEAVTELLSAAIARGVRSAFAIRLLGEVREEHPERSASSASLEDAQPLEEPLSERELDVLRLVAAGLSNKEIAETLVIAVGTTKRHLTNINGKLGVSSRTRAVARARELGLLD